MAVGVAVAVGVGVAVVVVVVMIPITPELEEAYKEIAEHLPKGDKMKSLSERLAIYLEPANNEAWEFKALRDHKNMLEDLQEQAALLRECAEVVYWVAGTGDTDAIEMAKKLKKEGF